MNASAIKPAVMNVIPNPRKAGGISEYFSFSRIAAINTIATAQLKPEPIPYTTLCGKLNFFSTISSEPARIAQLTVINGRKIPKAL